MTDSEMPGDIQNIVETVIELLEEDTIAREVEYPVNQAIKEFQFVFEEPITPAGFNRIIASFVTHINKRGLRFPRMLTDREALAEAVYLLDRYSDAEDPDRYAAIMTIVGANDREEMEKTLLMLAEIIKVIEREKYRRWVFQYHFRSLEWEYQCRIVSLLKKSLSHTIVSELERLKPAQLVEYFEELIDIDLISRNIVKQLGWEKEKQIQKESLSFQTSKRASSE